MKFLNDFKNLFAILGVVSIIFWTCSAESSSDDSSSNLPQITGGTYQVENLNGNQIVVLNTESGVMKTYYRNSSNLYIWTDYSDFDGIDRTITFTH
tara:strand:- start:4381 stop:4668 length:288 start_codon:yes stop_codon:yes gene_type:complete